MTCEKSNSLARHFSPMVHAKCLLPRLDRLLPVRSCLKYFYQWLVGQINLERHKNSDDDLRFPAWWTEEERTIDWKRLKVRILQNIISVLSFSQKRKVYNLSVEEPMHNFFFTKGVIEWHSILLFKIKFKA